MLPKFACIFKQYLKSDNRFFKAIIIFDASTHFATLTSLRCSLESGSIYKLAPERLPNYDVQ